MLAINRVPAGTKTKHLDLLAQKLIARANEGDVTALKEIGDRLDGKPTQMIAGDPERPIFHRIERVIVNAQD